MIFPPGREDGELFGHVSGPVEAGYNLGVFGAKQDVYGFEYLPPNMCVLVLSTLDDSNEVVLVDFDVGECPCTLLQVEVFPHVLLCTIGCHSIGWIFRWYGLSEYF